MKLNLYKDEERQLDISGEEGRDKVSISFKSIYGENVIRNYKFSDNYDMADFLESADYYLTLWGFWGSEYDIQQIFDRIDDFLYEIGICY